MEEDELLDNQATWASESGFMIWVGDGVTFMGTPLSKSVRDCISHAQNSGAEYLMFNHHAPPIPGVQIHNWN